MRLSYRFFLILLGFSLAPVLVTGAWLLRSNAAARDNARQLHEQVTRLCADSVEAFAGDLNRALGFIQELESAGLVSQSPRPVSARAKAAPRVAQDYLILQREAVTHPAMGLISLLGPDGRETIRFADARSFPSTGFEDRSHDPLVMQVRVSSQAAWGQVIERQGQPFLPIVHPLPAGKLLYVEYSLDSLSRRISGLKLGRTGRLFLLDSAGRPLPGFAEGYPEPTLAFSEPVGWLDAVSSRRGSLVVAWAVCPSFGWRVLSLQSRSEALAVSPHFAAQVGLFLAVVTSLVVLGALWMGSRMARPLQFLIVGAQNAARNQFDQPVPETGWGELSMLTRGFNVMMRTLRTYQEMQVDRLFEEKAKVESLVHTIPDGIVMAGFDGQIIYMNLTARAILAGDTSGNVTLPGTRTVHETFREPALRELVLSLMQRRKVSCSRELELRNRDGQRLGIFSCRAVTVMHNKKEIGIVVTLRNMTAERDLERLREDFYHGVVHDLRGPLTSVDGFVRILQTSWSRMTEDKAKTYLGYVRVSADRMRQLVADILDTAKIESGTMKLDLQPVAAADFAERAKALYALQTETGERVMSFEAATSPGQPLVCDRNLIERVLMNLMGNALKFTPKGGQVALRVAVAGPQEVEFSVQDTGPGIPKDKLEFVFEKFKQLDGEHRSAGYGLGLSICKKIVELHRGRIWCESEVGRGSRFAFRLPLQGPGAGLTPPSA